jgi:hypothetical protein
MSKLEVNAIDSVGTTLTLGDTNATTLALNSGITTLPSALKNTPAFVARMSATQNISNNTETLVNFDTEIFDDDGVFDNSSGNYKFTVPSGQAGKYSIYGRVLLDSQSAANMQNCQMILYKNGAKHEYNYWNFNSNDILGCTVEIQSILDLSDGDYIQMYAKISDASGSPRFDYDERIARFTGYKLIGA